MVQTGTFELQERDWWDALDASETWLREQLDEAHDKGVDRAESRLLPEIDRLEKKVATLQREVLALRLGATVQQELRGPADVDDYPNLSKN